MINILSLTIPEETSELIEIIGKYMPAGTRMSSARNSREARKKLNEEYYDIAIFSGYFPESETLIAKGIEKGIDVAIIDGYIPGLREIAKKAGARVFSAPKMEGLKEYLLDIIMEKQEEYTRENPAKKSLSS